MSDLLNQSCRSVVERLRQHDIFYDAFVITVETAIKDYTAKHEDTDIKAMAETIVKRISGEC